MTDNRKCPECGAELPPDSPEGLCPKCLMNQGLESQPERPTPPGGFTPPEPEELASQFPQLEILELLGRGGMGAVYKARQPQLDRFVALKILPAQIGEDPQFAERFTREARSLARLNHTHIVTLHDFGQTGEGLFYFIMEFVDGPNLRQVIQGHELSPQEALAIVPQVCDALQFAHEEGIVHRDIKPENVLLDKKGRVKIADFGLAKLLGVETAGFNLTGTQQVMGTPHYMAPEQFDNPLAVDHRADIYSLGVVLYEMLTGELPIGRFAPPSQKVQIDVRLDEVVLKTLENKPDLRYQHASDVKTEVESITRSPKEEPSAWRQYPHLSEGPDEQKSWLRWKTLTIALIGTVTCFYLSGLNFGPVVLLAGVIIFFGIVTASLYQTWGTPQAWSSAFGWVLALFAFLPFMLFYPQPVLDLLYGVTGMQPGPADPTGARFIIAFLLILIGMFLRVAWQKGAREVLSQRLGLQWMSPSPGKRSDSNSISKSDAEYKKGELGIAAKILIVIVTTAIATLIGIAITNMAIDASQVRKSLAGNLVLYLIGSGAGFVMGLLASIYAVLFARPRDYFHTLLPIGTILTATLIGVAITSVAIDSSADKMNRSGILAMYWMSAGLGYAVGFLTSIAALLVSGVSYHRNKKRWHEESSGGREEAHGNESATSEIPSIAVPSTSDLGSVLKRKWLNWYASRTPTNRSLINVALLVVLFPCLLLWLSYSSTWNSDGNASYRLGIPSPWVEYKFVSEGRVKSSNIHFYLFTLSWLFMLGYILSYKGYVAIKEAETNPTFPKWALRVFKICVNGIVVAALSGFVWNVYAQMARDDSFSQSQVEAVGGKMEAALAIEEPTSLGARTPVLGNPEPMALDAAQRLLAEEAIQEGDLDSALDAILVLSLGLGRDASLVDLIKKAGEEGNVRVAKKALAHCF